ncbi:hypothetical protein BYT27DRAFT_7227074 [Phlegmacium glaucopus]|nr:hypothetical protein BYT27DRAFT_7227074 [Phlegmacium glaucopus]
MRLHPSKGKGKRKASPSPSSSSVEDDSITDTSRPVVKRIRLSSPARVKQAAMAKMVSKSKLSSSSKGLAGFTALVNNANLSAARMETNHGLRSGSSSLRSRGGGASAKSKAEKTEDGFSVGMIVFLVVGIMENSDAGLSDSASFRPVYCLRSDVDISPVALTGMKQSSLCLMKDSGFDFLSSDTYSIIDNKLCILFPDLFDWICESEPDDATTSSWLIYDRSLPTGFDIMTAFTREPVPSQILKKWRPIVPLQQISTSNKDSDVEDMSSDDAKGPLSFPSIPPPPSQLRWNRSEDEVEEDIISISTDSVSDDEQPAPVVNASTPPYVNTIQDYFNSSMNFGDEGNPWIS